MVPAAPCSRQGQDPERGPTDQQTDINGREDDGAVDDIVWARSVALFKTHDDVEVEHDDHRDDEPNQGGEYDGQRRRDLVL